MRAHHFLLLFLFILFGNWRQKRILIIEKKKRRSETTRKKKKKKMYFYHRWKWCFWWCAFKHKVILCHVLLLSGIFRIELVVFSFFMCSSLSRQSLSVFFWLSFYFVRVRISWNIWKEVEDEKKKNVIIVVH